MSNRSSGRTQENFSTCIVSFSWENETMLFLTILPACGQKTATLGITQHPKAQSSTPTALVKAQKHAKTHQNGSNFNDH
jgi:hypothetical protein